MDIISNDLKNRNVGQTSNELEFIVDGVTVPEVILELNSLNHGASFVQEINGMHVVELNSPIKKDVAELNNAVGEYIKQTIRIVENLKGSIRGGAAVLKDVSGVSPNRYLTTSLSEACAQGFKEITSQQIVLGVNNEKYAFELYNFFRRINPLLLGISASSPYTSVDGRTVQRSQNNAQSVRPQTYQRLLQYFPDIMKQMPILSSLKQYDTIMEQASAEIWTAFEQGRLDTNFEELGRERTSLKGGSYAKMFKSDPRLNSSQVYWAIRPRPEHKTTDLPREHPNYGDSLFSLELRIPDMPTTPDRMQMLNAFVLGIAYYIADHGRSSIHIPRYLDGSINQLESAGLQGLDTKFRERTARQLVGNLMNFAFQGLNERGYFSEAKRMDLLDTVLTHGNDAQLMINYRPKDAEQLRGALAQRLKQGESYAFNH